MLMIPNETPGKTDVIVMEVEQYKEFLTEWFEAGNAWCKHASMEELLNDKLVGDLERLFRRRIPAGDRLAWSIIRYPRHLKEKNNLVWCWESWYKQREDVYVLYEYDQIHITTEDTFADIFSILNREGGGKNAESS